MTWRRWPPDVRRLVVEVVILWALALVSLLAVQSVGLTAFCCVALVFILGKLWARLRWWEGK